MFADLLSLPNAIDTFLHWLALLIYICGASLNVFGVIFERPLAEKRSVNIIVAGIVVHSAALGYRWFESGHGPYVAQYEILSSGAWVCLIFYLLYRHKFVFLHAVSIIVFPLIFLMLAGGLMCTPEVQHLPPSLKSIWLVVHASFYKVAAASLIVALGCSILQIIGDSLPNRVRQIVSAQADFDSYTHRFCGFGFIFWAVATLSGSIWAYQAWGRYWGWDPIENWSLITWLLLGLYLHLRKFHNLEGKRAGWLYLLCFASAVFTLFFASVIDPSTHTAYFQR